MEAVSEDFGLDDGAGPGEVAGDGGLGSLISFSNLENVVRHIIQKFKSNEMHKEATDAQMMELRKDLEVRATVQTLDEVTSELKSTVDQFHKSLGSQKDNISGLENQIERNRVLCQTIDKKLEAVTKEKMVQDRLVRETQDALQDKVAVAELNMFEAKFAGYTTRLEHQETIDMLTHYTRVDVTERVAESVKALGAQFNDYTRSSKIQQHLQELRDWVSNELQGYAKAHTTASKIEELQTQMKDQVLAFERVHALMDDKIRGLSDRMTSIYAELQDDIHQRALADDLNAVQRDLRKYALRAEADAFQQDCVPKLKFCVDSIKAFDERLRAQDGAISRVDEILLDKASKYEVVVANSRIELCLEKEKGQTEFQKMYERFEWITKKLENYIETETARFNQYRPPDYTPVFEEISTNMQLKADKADLVEMYQLKANRIDSDELAKLQNIIHQQLEYLAVTNFGLSKLSLTDAKPGESKTERMRNKTLVLMQSEALWNWILHNEPPSNLETLRPPPAARIAPPQGGGTRNKPERTPEKGSAPQDQVDGGFGLELSDGRRDRGAAGDNSVGRRLIQEKSTREGYPKGSAGSTASDPEADQQKRKMDDERRGRLEGKLGISLPPV